MKEKPYKNEKAKKNTSRGSSTILTYAIVLGITIVFVGLTVGAFATTLEQQAENAKEQQLQISAVQLAIELEKADTLIREGTQPIMVLRPEYSERAGNEGYVVEIKSTSTNNVYKLVLTTASGDISVSKKFRSFTPVKTGSQSNSTNLIITYKESDGFIKLKSVDSAPLVASKSVKNINGNYTIPSDTQDPELNVSGFVTGGKNTYVQGDLSAGGYIDTNSALSVAGNVDTDTTATLGSDSYVQKDLTAGGDVYLSQGTIVDGTVITGGQVYAESSVTVGKNVTATNGNPITFMSEADVGGKITGGNTSIGGNSEVHSIDSSGSVDLGNGVKSDGSVNASGNITFGKNNTITGAIESTNGDISLNGGTFAASTVTSGGQVTSGDDTSTGEIIADTTVSLGSGVNVSGDITSNTSSVSVGSLSDVSGSITADSDVTIGGGTTVSGDITSNGVVTLKSDVVVEGDVFVNSGSDLSCETNVTINGVSCSTYKSNNY